VLKDEDLVVVAFVDKECFWCHKMEKPWKALAKRHKSLTFVVAEFHEKDVIPYEVDGYPSYILFEEGEIVGRVEGADILELRREVSKLKGQKPRGASAPYINGVIYSITDDEKAYIGQTYQDPEKRWAQELRSNQLIGEVMRTKGGKIKKSVINRICKGTNKQQVRDCLDFFEKNLIEEYDSFENGYNQTRGNRGRSVKEGYDYRHCLPGKGKRKLKEEVEVETSDDEGEVEEKEEKKKRKPKKIEKKKKKQGKKSGNSRVYITSKEGKGVYHTKKGHYGAEKAISMNTAEKEARSACLTCN